MGDKRGETEDKGRKEGKYKGGGRMRGREDGKVGG